MTVLQKPKREEFRKIYNMRVICILLIDRYSIDAIDRVYAKKVQIEGFIRRSN